MDVWTDKNIRFRKSDMKANPRVALIIIGNNQGVLFNVVWDADRRLGSSLI